MSQIKYILENISNKLLIKINNLIRIFLDLVAVIIGLRFPTKQKYLPPIHNRLLLESAVQLSKKIKSGKLKSEEVVRAYIDRCIAVQPHINAIIEDNFEAAINEAKEVDKRIKHELEGNKPENGVSIQMQPFLGVPFTTKDSISVKDMYLTSGLYSRKGITANEDSDVVDLLRKSGAIFIALTNVPELVMWWHSYNILYGRTNNPYDKSRIPGGSSGGEGALISSAGSVIGMGSDIGGSIREPSYFCGIFGHKTTSGIVSTRGMYPVFSPSRQKLLSVGPMCRYATDLKPMLKVMAGKNANKLKLDQSVDIRKLKVYFMEGHENPSISPLQPEIKDSMNKVINYFNNKGLSTKKVFFEEIQYGFNIWMCAMDDKNAPKLTQELANLKGEINPYFEFIKSIFGLSNYTFCSIISCFDLITNHSSEENFNKLTQMRKKLTKELHELLGNDGVFIFPAHPEVAPKHNSTVIKVKNISYTCLFNTLNVAITSVPLGLSTSGLPLGIQIITTQFNDHLSIAVAEELEKAFGGWVCPSEINC